MASGDFLMLNFANFAGDGVATKDDDVVFAFHTVEGQPIDVTLSRDQALALAGKLTAAARS
jgi:hypothetical protein